MDMLGGDGEGGSSTLNPLAAIGASLAAGAVEGASDDVREDTNVVVATLPREQQLIGKLLSGASGRPSIVYRVWQALLLLSAAWAVTGGTRVDAAWAGMAEPNQLILVDLFATQSLETGTDALHVVVPSLRAFDF